MSTKSLSLTALFGILAGVILIIANRSINSTGIVTTGGIIFIVAGILNIFLFNSSRDIDGEKRNAVASTFGLVASIGAVVLGVCMIIFKPTFVVLVPYIFGIIVAVLAIYQVYLLAIGSRPTLLPAWFYLIPLALIGASIYIFMRQAHYDDNIIMLTSGISLCVFGLFTAIEAILIKNRRKGIETKEQDLSK